jgi:hypothetical protein
MYTLYQSESKKKLLANINKRENYLSQSLTEHTKTKTRLVFDYFIGIADDLRLREFTDECSVCSAPAMILLKLSGKRIM